MVGDDDRVHVPWAEAREVLALVLLIAAVSHVTGPIVRHFAIDSQFDFWDDLRVILSNVNTTTGLLLVGSAITICTTDREDTVPTLRRAVSVVARVVTVFGIVAMINVLTARSAADSVFLRISLVMIASGPGTLLAGLAAWLVDRVDVVSEPK